MLVLIRFRNSILLSHECSLPLGDARAFKDVLCIAQGESKGYFKLDPCGTRIMISTRFHLGLLTGATRRREFPLRVGFASELAVSVGQKQMRFLRLGLYLHRLFQVIQRSKRIAL